VRGVAMTRILYAMPYSPWSERARFALLHHRTAFEEREHVPVLGELALRVRSRRPLSRVSIPMLVEDGRAIVDSLAIAEHVDAHGAGERLFPAEHRESIRELNAAIEPMLEAGRARSIQTNMHDDEAALDLVPPPLRNLPFALETSRLGSRFIAWKHPTSFDAILRRLCEGISDIRRALGDREYVHGTFTYADIIAATALQLVQPVSDRYIAISPVKRRTWSDPDLAEEFKELVQWRDRLYEKHRPVIGAQ
jgi:glutathione S-transferase